MRFPPGLVILLGLLPVGLHAACSASNGGPIPGEVYDASPLEAGMPPLRDGGPGEDATTHPPNDSGDRDAPADAPADAPLTSEGVRINEVYVGRVGAGDATEYVELRGRPNTQVDDLILRLIDRLGNVDYEVDVGVSGARIGSSGTWVVGGGAVVGVGARVDRTVPISGWGLDTRGAIQLVRGGAKTLLDVVGYTTETDGGAFAPEPSTAPKSTGEGAPYLLSVVGAAAFGRAPGATDTDVNKADFCTLAARSPGSANGPCAAQ